MEESPIKITLTVQLALTIDPTEQYPLAVISECSFKPRFKSSLLGVGEQWLELFHRQGWKQLSPQGE